MLIHHLELEWGFRRNAIPSSKAKRRQPFHDLLHPRGGAPAPHPSHAGYSRLFEQRGVFGAGGWFHEYSDEWFDNTLYEKYADMWGSGPEIPLFCKIWIRDSSGAAVIAPKAIGKTKFLWDWESRAAAVTSTFASNAQNYDVNVTQPTGQNCHKDRGGKRGGGKPVFPEQDGYGPRDDPKDDDFPFEVEKQAIPRANGPPIAMPGAPTNWVARPAYCFNHRAWPATSIA